MAKTKSVADEIYAIAQRMVDERHEEIAQEILQEVRTEVLAVTVGRGGHCSDETLNSYRILDDTGGASVSGSMHSRVQRKGLRTRRTISVGSDHKKAFFIEYGNDQKYRYFGGKKNPNAPNYTGSGKRVLKYDDGSLHTYSSTYGGRYPVHHVALRHRG